MHPHKCSDLCRDAGGLPSIARIISAQNDNLPDALATFATLISRSEPNALATLNIGGLVMLTDLLSSQNVDTQFLALKCIASLCAFPKVLELIPPVGTMTAVLSSLLVSDSVDIIGLALELLGTICVHDVHREHLAATGKLSVVANLLANKNELIQQMALRLISSLCSSDKMDDPIRDKIGELGLLPSIISMISSTNGNVAQYATNALRESCRSFKNR